MCATSARSTRFCVRLGAELGHFQELRALNAICARLGGAGGHRRNLAALAEIAGILAGSGAAWSAGPVRLFGAGDSRFADGRQGTPPYDSGYVLHRYSALNLAVWALRGKVEHDARRDLFATSGATLQQWIDTHLAGLQEAMADSANPVVVVHLGTHSLPGVPLAEIQDQAGTIIGALTGAGARVLWLLENPRSRWSALGPANEQKRLDYNAWLVAQEGAHGGLFRTLDYLAGFTADGTATGATALPGLQRDDLHDTQAGAFIKAAAILGVIETFPPVSGAAEYAGSAEGYDAAANPDRQPARRRGLVGRDPQPRRHRRREKPDLRLLHRVSRRPHLAGDAARRRRRRRRARAVLPGALRHGLRGGDTVRYRVRVRWENLSTSAPSR